ncbi:VOC family protein [Nemorincola caseinilytica]|uniref:VOC family protein n=1 Tax=Nemorincola caseinilytica TaxID=2054315 RepID=A0ABP8NIL6_9BACT
MAQLSPYLTFNGNCMEAFEFYRSVFGGEFSAIMKNSDIPEGVPSMPGTDPEKLLHISLPISAETVLMGCDMPAAYGQAVFGTNFAISINTAGEEETTKLFNGLSAGGKITMPLGDTFWGAFFGMFIDKFGIHWMVSYNKNPQK